jgi:hypothetical protein
MGKCERANENGQKTEPAPSAGRCFYGEGSFRLHWRMAYTDLRLLDRSIDQTRVPNRKSCWLRWLWARVAICRCNGSATLTHWHYILCACIPPSSVGLRILSRAPRIFCEKFGPGGGCLALRSRLNSEDLIRRRGEGMMATEDRSTARAVRLIADANCYGRISIGRLSKKFIPRYARSDPAVSRGNEAWRDCLCAWCVASLPFSPFSLA